MQVEVATKFNGFKITDPSWMMGMQKDYEETAVVFGSPILCTANGVSATTGDFCQKIAVGEAK